MSGIFYRIKSKVHPRIGHEDPEGDSTPSLTLVLDGGGWSMSHPG